MEPIKFNDTSEYSFMDILGVEGVFTSLRIDRDSLPEGFHKYSLRSGEEDMIESISSDVMVNHAGDFITKDILQLGTDGEITLKPSDWRWSQKNFDFEKHFGVKLSLDCQITLADEKRIMQMGEGRGEPVHIKGSPQRSR